MKAVIRTLALVAFGLGALAGCPQCAPGTVGEGVARLTVRNVGAITTLVNNDASCGFAADDVKAGAAFNGELGGLGTMTLTVTDCEIDAGTDTEVSSDCDDVKTKASGKITVSAKQTITGLITGDPAQPIVPATADSVVIELTSVKFDNFHVTKSTSDDSLTMVTGSIKAKVAPRLAVSASSGACAISTPNVTFTDIAYGESTVHVDTPDNKFDADVKESKFSAQNGKKGDAENSISGNITVFGSDVPVEGDGALDPDYDAGAFKGSYACTDDLADPESYTCGDITPQLADGAARLSVKMLGTVVSLIDADTTCGFSSNAVLGAGTTSGTLGGAGDITFTTTACTLTFPEGSLGDADCNGDATQFSGSVTVTGTKKISGRLAGSATTPVIPDSNTPAEFDLTITVDNFKVGDDTNALTAVSGTLAGKLQPVTAFSDTDGACSIATPAATISDVAWTSANTLLAAGPKSFQLVIDSGTLDATNGNVGGSTNALSGSLTIGGTAYTVPSDGAGLNPEYSQATFDASWQCNPDLGTDPSGDCTFVAPIAIGASQLTVRTFGTVVSLIDADPAGGLVTCGFKSAAVGGTPTFDGAIGDDNVTATFSLAPEGCTITVPANTTLSTDCAGNVTKAEGTIVVRGSKTVRGRSTGDPLEPVIPTSRDPAEFSLDITFTNFRVISEPVGATEAQPVLLVRSGTLTGTAAPRVALDITTGVCSKGTPVVTFSDMAWSNGDVQLVADGNTFDMALTASNIAAQNGTKDAEENSIAVDITVGADQIVVPTLDLVEGYDQALFESTFTCDPNLLIAPAEQACSFKSVLGGIAAKLIVKATGVAGKALNDNTVCGFGTGSSANVAPVPSGTPPAPGTTTSTTTESCTVVNIPVAGDFPLGAEDCVETQTTTSGIGSITVPAGAQRVVTGLFTGSAAAPFVPTAPNATVATATDVAFSTFTVFDRLVDLSVPAKVTLTGTLSATVLPRTGKSASASGLLGFDVFSIATPVAEFQDITMADGTLVIVVPGKNPAATTKTFRVTVTDANIDALNGGFGGAFNDVSGTLTVDGEAVTVAPSDLVTGLTQAAFDATYVCTPDLANVLDPG